MQKKNNGLETKILSINLKCLSPPGKEHANTERQATVHDQEIISGEAEQAQDAGQHKEEVDQRGVRFSFYKHKTASCNHLYPFLVFGFTRRRQI